MGEKKRSVRAEGQGLLKHTFSFPFFFLLFARILHKPKQYLYTEINSGHFTTAENYTFVL